MDLIGFPKEFFICADNISESMWASEGNIMADLFTSALSGMNAAQIGLATAQHNIANANTPGYTRQQVLLGSAGGVQGGSGFVGQGVNVAGVIRIYDQFLNTQVLQEQNQASYLTAYSSAVSQVNNLIADPTVGVAPAMQSFFESLNGVANNPESVPARQTLLGNAQVAVNRFQAIDQRLTDIARGVNGQIVDSVNNVNSYAKQIAVLNGDIKRATASGQGQQPNDLIDQRDQLISQLNQEIKTSVLHQSDGTASVLAGSGQALVVGEQSMRLQVIQSANDSSKVDIAYVNNGKITSLQQSSLQGGNIGAYLNFRDQTLDPARNKLGLVAIGMAASVNQQNQLGQDLNGAPGSDIFNTISPRVEMNANNNSASDAPSVAITNVAGLIASDYQLRSNGGSNYTLLRLSDNATTSLNLTVPQTVDGMTITAPTSVAAGDSFLIRPTANGARDIALATNDPAKIAAAAPMRTKATLSNTGTGMISAGGVDAKYTAATVTPAVTLTYTSGTNMLTGFPATLPVTVTNNGVATVFAAGVPVTYTDGATVSFGGVSFTLTGAPANGDTFTVTPNTNATGDSRNALLMAGLQTKNLMANGLLNLQEAYGQLVGEVGAKANEMTVLSSAQTNMAAHTVAAQQAVSGVNLDEEAANLLRYQNAYQAAAKAMQIAKTMFDAILAINP